MAYIEMLITEDKIPSDIEQEFKLKCTKLDNGYLYQFWGDPVVREQTLEVTLLSKDKLFFELDYIKPVEPIIQNQSNLSFPLVKQQDPIYVCKKIIVTQ